MNRTMYTWLTVFDDNPNEVGGVLITQFGEGGLPDNEFWVSRDEAEDTIRLIADAFDLDLSEVAQ